MQNIKKNFRPRRISLGLIISISVFLILITPTVSLSVDPPPLNSLVPCDNVTKTCDFNQLLDMVNEVIKFIIFKMAVPIAAIMFFYAGFMMVTAGGEAAGARTKAKEIFTNTVLGLVLAIAAWLIVRTILSILGYKGDWIGF